MRRPVEGAFTCCLKDSERAASVEELPGTTSHVVGLVNAEGTVVCKMHFYLRPDGRLGASGRPDPKWLLEDGVVYQADRPRGRSEVTG